MKSFIALALAASAAALPSLKGGEETIHFSGVAIRSGGDIQYAPIAANGSSFWLNKDTATYTPDIPQIPINNNRTTSTVFSFYLPGDTLSLYTTVPGGQQAYVAADGKLKFTIAHSGYTGNGSVTQGFGIAQGHLLFENTGFLAVATNETSNIPDNKGTAYQIYAASRTNLTGEGFAFRAIAADNTTVSAWQYV
ncbi:uncharacterized protein CLAFUR5_07257 [Fulvia fulva]|uniref:Uncharacterized protein n=1 Tax=Passalora fulva TaxID=5499 RepID=A0A9Q8P9Z8_PASFU|nr:uncharacterized protein CLAFUR5_07257 [Fulvia fulva]KAK4622841.1 hypothetical protein CLAFUR0_07130 [Fulvia fulva]UJO18613.1 hypothetical protein CLAFUR5_07257 [Fulvia fulva]WPV31037.1 hypothetical protein CLAFUW7_07124 [Fulvia fulva]